MITPLPNRRWRSIATPWTVLAGNSCTQSVQASGPGFDEIWMRLQRCDEMRAILKEIVLAPDESIRTIAIQCAGCMLGSRTLSSVT